MPSRPAAASGSPGPPVGLPPLSSPLAERSCRPRPGLQNNAESPLPPQPSLPPSLHDPLSPLPARPHRPSSWRRGASRRLQRQGAWRSRTCQASYPANSRCDPTAAVPLPAPCKRIQAIDGASATRSEKASLVQLGPPPCAVRPIGCKRSAWEVEGER